MLRLLFPLALLLLGSCVTTHVRRPVRPQGEMRIGKPSLAWEVLDASGSNVGLVVLFEAGGDLEPTYMVRNEWHQDLGRVDQLGRAFRYVPHAEEAAWVGSGTLLQGVERILGHGSCLLIETPIALPKNTPSSGQILSKEAAALAPPSKAAGAPESGSEPASPPIKPGTQDSQSVFPQFTD